MKNPLYFFTSHVFMSPDDFKEFESQMVLFFKTKQPLLEQLSVSYDHIGGLATLTVASKTEIDEMATRIMERFIAEKHLNNFCFYLNKWSASVKNLHFGSWVIKVDNFQSAFSQHLKNSLESLFSDLNLVEVEIQPLYKKYVLIRVISCESLTDKALSKINAELSEFLKISSICS